MGPFGPPGPPPATAEYVATLQTAAQSAAAPKQTAYRFFRAGDGKTRVDSGNMSIIQDPASGKTIVLDHLKQEAQVLPSAPHPPAMALPPMPQMPGMPGLPAMPPPPAVHAQDLGKTLLQGQEVEGKRYTIQPPAPPPLPPMPQLPGMPKPPQMPPPPHAPTTAEVWTSTRLQLPMASKITGSFGQQTSICQNAIPGEPHPAVFQIPPGYKQLIPKPPAPPRLPAV